MSGTGRAPDDVAVTEDLLTDRAWHALPGARALEEFGSDQGPSGTARR